MTSTDILYAAIAELIGGVGGTLFVVIYCILSPWYKNQYGRNVMFFTAGITFFFDYAAIYYYLEYPRPMPLVMIRVQEVIISLLVLLVWQRLFQMIRAQIFERATSWRKEPEKDDHERRVWRRLRLLSGRREPDREQG